MIIRSAGYMSALQLCKYRLSRYDIEVGIERYGRKNF